jgi:hypothetical protein
MDPAISAVAVRLEAQSGATLALRARNSENVRPMFRGICSLVSVAALISFLPLPLAAQQPVMLRGTVLDSYTGESVTGALLLLDSGQETQTDASGEYVFFDVPPGTHRIAIVTPACQVSFGELDVGRLSAAYVAFQVAEGAVEAVRRSMMAGSAAGELVTAAEIEEMHVGTLSQVLQRVAPEFVRTPGNQPGLESRLSTARTRSGAGPVSPVLILDGVNLGSDGASQMMDFIAAHDIAYLEILRGASGGWSYGTGASGGVIRVISKRGGASSPPGLDPRRCEIPGWR